MLYTAFLCSDALVFERIIRYSSNIVLEDEEDLEGKLALKWAVQCLCTPQAHFSEVSQIDHKEHMNCQASRRGHEADQIRVPLKISSQKIEELANAKPKKTPDRQTTITLASLAEPGEETRNAQKSPWQQPDQE
nr:unnamed protein product [Ipomoea batatas]